MPHLKVIIIGAGLGGLCLAQALHNAQIDVEIFERDSSPWDRPQGYRLHLEADGLFALHEVLSPELHRLFQATAMQTEPFTTILKTDLSVLKRLPTSDDQDAEAWPDFASGETVHCNVDRATLRAIRLMGLNNICHFGKKLVRYEPTGKGVVAHFSDGTEVHGDVLVGADGIRSAVRQQRAPQLQLMDAGVQAIYGRVSYAEAAKILPSEAMKDIFSIASDERKVFLGLGAVKFPLAPDEAAKQLSASEPLRQQNDYVVCIVGGRHECFPKTDTELRGKSPKDLQTLAVATLDKWPEAARTFVSKGDPSSFFIVGMSTSVPGTLDKPTNVTMLGDAVHAMTPTLGRGANLAMRDAALLSRALKAVAAGERVLEEALQDYESGLLKYGFDVVRQSVKLGEQRMGQNPLPA